MPPQLLRVATRLLQSLTDAIDIETWTVQYSASIIFTPLAADVYSSRPFDDLGEHSIYRKLVNGCHPSAHINGSSSGLLRAATTTATSPAVYPICQSSATQSLNDTRYINPPSTVGASDHTRHGCSDPALPSGIQAYVPGSSASATKPHDLNQQASPGMLQQDPFVAPLSMTAASQELAQTKDAVNDTNPVTIARPQKKQLAHQFAASQLESAAAPQLLQPRMTITTQGNSIKAVDKNIRQRPAEAINHKI